MPNKSKARQLVDAITSDPPSAERKGSESFTFEPENPDNNEFGVFIGRKKVGSLNATVDNCQLVIGGALDEDLMDDGDRFEDACRELADFIAKDYRAGYGKDFLNR